MVFRKVRRVIPDISLDTVNRTLLTLNNMGVAFVVEGSGGPKRYDANLESHQHFKCIKCKRVIDLFYEFPDDLKVPASVRRRFTILRKSVYLEGICDLCRRRR